MLSTSDKGKDVAQLWSHLLANDVYFAETHTPYSSGVEQVEQDSICFRKSLGLL